MLRSADRFKDQTYFLSMLSAAQLSKARFPIGGFTKPQVRDMAAEWKLPTQARKDSQGICFLGQLKFDDFLRHHLGEDAGPIMERETGSIIGQHAGLWFHTIGQRRGIGPCLDPVQVSRGPWYVVEKQIAQNILLVSRTPLFSKSRRQFHVHQISWTCGHAPVEFKTRNELALVVQVRHGPTDLCATVRLESGSNGSKATVNVEQEDKGLAAGQFAAFYREDECLGGGVIVL